MPAGGKISRRMVRIYIDIYIYIYIYIYIFEFVLFTYQN
jgi:hypothetical protein